MHVINFDCFKCDKEKQDKITVHVLFHEENEIYKCNHSFQ